MDIRAPLATEWGQAVALFNACRERGETPYRPLAGAEGLQGPGQTSFVAVENGRVLGWIHGAVKTRFLPGENGENTPGYLTLVMVAPDARGEGIGGRLLRALRESFARQGKTRVVCSGSNPVSLSWLIPGSPGHDHNNAPGVEESCAGYPFLLRNGFRAACHEVAMYMDLKGFRWDESLDDVIAALNGRGIQIGRWVPSMGDDVDGLCDRVGSEYWRHVLKTELAAWRENRPNDDPTLWPDGRQPGGPRTLLTAAKDGKILGFTGPVDRQESGRGWFTGICVDPLAGGLGIGTVLFNLLLREFAAEGAAFTSLFTGTENCAQKIYLRAGLKPVARFAIMTAGE